MVAIGLATVACLASRAAAGEHPKKYTETVVTRDDEKISFEMVRIPGGKFTMGSPGAESGRKAHEGPAHEVEVGPFYLCTTETTFELFLPYYYETVRSKEEAEAEAKRRAKEAEKLGVDAVSHPTPVYGDVTMGWGGGKRPAAGLTWLNAANFCKWLSKKTGKKYRLPTEAEWEYACRARTKTAFPFGNDPSKLGEYAWFEDNSDEKTQEAAQKKPNPFGLYDMHGNVREWVHDFYSTKAYAEAPKSNPARNPTGPQKGTAKTAHGFAHVARGGAWDSPAKELRSAARAFEEDWWRCEDPQEPKSKWWLPKMAFIGFRVARSIDDK